MKRLLTAGTALTLAAAMLGACGGDDSDTETSATTAGRSATTAAASATTAASGGTTLTVVATDFAFDKTTLSATAGSTVTFVVKNEAEKVEHNLTIEDLKVDKDVEAGETAQQTVADLKAGTYEYHCEYHPSQMKGTLTVS